jgi:parallel beta-helix repeat protein
VTEGGNMILDTAPAMGSDDVIVGTRIQSGPNGVCESTAAFDDGQALPVGQGTPASSCVTPGADGSLETAVSGDDAVAVSTITSGPNGICESSAVTGAGFLEEGTANRINTCTVYKNAGDGVHLAGSGNALQLSTVSQNRGAQVRITGDNNWLQENALTRVSAPSVFASTTPAVLAPAGADSNFFDRTRVSLGSGAVTGDGYTVVEPTNNGTQNSRAPGDPLDPPANLR